MIVAAAARGPSCATVPVSVSEPRELLSTTWWPASMASCARVMPMFPLPISPTVVIGFLSSAGGEVVAVVQTVEQAGLGGFPAEGLAGDEVGRRVALRDDIREEPEVARHHQGVGGDAHDGQAEPAADGLGDVAERDGAVRDRVPVAAGRTLFPSQAEHGGGVAGVHGV